MQTKLKGKKAKLHLYDLMGESVLLSVTDPSGPSYCPNILVFRKEGTITLSPHPNKSFITQDLETKCIEVIS